MVRLPSHPPFARMLRWSDAWWLLAVPVYAVLNVTRHEASHALVGVLQGARVLAFSVLPDSDPPFPGGSWGYVILNEYPEPHWPRVAAPFICDALVFALGVVLVRRASRSGPRWLWINVLILFIGGPIWNSVRAWSRFVDPGHDVGQLIWLLPDVVVHGWFAVTVPLYVAALLLVLRGHRWFAPPVASAPP